MNTQTEYKAKARFQALLRCSCSSRRSLNYHRNHLIALAKVQTKKHPRIEFGSVTEQIAEVWMFLRKFRLKLL